MRGRILAIALLLLAACEPGDAPRHTDTYVLALSWQPAFCETAMARPECREQNQDRLDARQFSLHGLWPQPGNRVWCGRDARAVEADKNGKWRAIAMQRLEPALWRRLQLAMPGTGSNLHRHEWIKHGTCMGNMDAPAYFETSLALLDQINASGLPQLFAGNPGRQLSGDQIRSVFERHFGAGTGKRLRLSCVNDGARRLISEITLGLKGRLNTGPLSAAEVARLLLAAPKTDPGCPKGFVDTVGDQ